MRRAALTVAALLLAAPVGAVTPAECTLREPAEGALVYPGEEVLTRIRQTPVDLGDGWVLQQYEIGSSVGTQWGAWVSDCASGTNLIVVEAAQRTGGPVRRLARVSAEEAFRAAIASDETVALNAVIRQLTNGGANVERDPMQPATHEVCGCAALYPELRGTKTRWTDWSRP